MYDTKRNVYSTNAKTLTDSQSYSIICHKKNRKK